MRVSLVISAIIITTVSVLSFLYSPRFGRNPQREILERIGASANYRGGKFQNLSPRINIFSEKSFFQAVRDFLFTKVEGLTPLTPLPSMKVNLKEISREENVMVWLGHSSLFIQIDRERFLIDPVLVAGSPVSFFNKPFKGAEAYSPEDIPDIDYLLITHDHWDHLDYEAVISIKNRVGKVICGLGVGEHFRHWGYNKKDIMELDWNESAMLKNDIALHILPAQHFSGRKFIGRDKTLWVSFMIVAPSLNIFISGDTGYSKHFFEIGQRFPTIDFAIFEFGQYGYDWRDIHLMPNDLVQAIKELNPKRSFAAHNSKYALAKHPWKAPLEFVSKLSEEHKFNIITPMMGELVYLEDCSQKFTKWWEE
ncbi:MAG: MBL fold metallo-hydrolase [Tannerella sp.]|jgi:L-ascorbate metabolism protein UlaG (beta-lactamase superfamily)|nr:MBL fold metallo-hydrolase [Tannerella sp.]